VPVLFYVIDSFSERGKKPVVAAIEPSPWPAGTGD
jgi:hypothetical protein